MASVYILYSTKANLFYVVSTKDVRTRLEQHILKEFSNSFTAKYQDWQLFYSIDGLSIYAAKKIEQHIKKMKSRVYLINLKKYPDIVKKLTNKYAGKEADTQSR